MTKRIAIVGSRDFQNLALVRRLIQSVPADAVIVCGGARGVDRVAAGEAAAMGRTTVIHVAQWDAEGRSAGFRRNARLADDADAMVAFWDGRSRGTPHAVHGQAGHARVRVRRLHHRRRRNQGGTRCEPLNRLSRSARCATRR